MTLAFRVLDGFILGYFLVVNSAYLGLVALASVEVVRHRRRVPFAGSTEAYHGRTDRCWSTPAGHPPSLSPTGHR